MNDSNEKKSNTSVENSSPLDNSFTNHELDLNKNLDEFDEEGNRYKENEIDEEDEDEDEDEDEIDETSEDDLDDDEDFQEEDLNDADGDLNDTNPRNPSQF